MSRTVAEENAAFSYLEFGAIDPVAGSKTVWDFRTGETAYDWFMLARYANDLAAYQRLCSHLSDSDLDTLISEYDSMIHHPDDFSVNLGKLLALGIAGAGQPRPCFFEIGQTLFGCVDGMEFCKALLERLDISFPKIDLHQVQWTGLDISPLFNQLAPLLHPGHTITTFDDPGKLASRYDVFFAKGVTLLYAVRSVAALFDLLGRCQLSLFDYSLSLEEEQHVVIGTGKPVVYLALAPFLAACRASGKSLYLKRGNSRLDRTTGRVWLDAVYGAPELCRQFVEHDQRVRSAMRIGLLDLPGERLLDTVGNRNSGWMTVEMFLSEQGVKTP